MEVIRMRDYRFTTVVKHTGDVDAALKVAEQNAKEYYGEKAFRLDHSSGEKIYIKDKNGITGQNWYETLFWFESEECW